MFYEYLTRALDSTPIWALLIPAISLLLTLLVLTATSDVFFESLTRSRDQILPLALCTAAVMILLGFLHPGHAPLWILTGLVARTLLSAIIWMMKQRPSSETHSLKQATGDLASGLSSLQRHQHLESEAGVLHDGACHAVHIVTLKDLVENVNDRKPVNDARVSRRLSSSRSRAHSDPDNRIKGW